MTTEVITLTSICSGGGHLVFSLTGEKTLTRVLGIEELTAPITDEELDAFLKVIVRMARIGRTQNQTRTLLQNGVTVTV